MAIVSARRAPTNFSNFDSLKSTETFSRQTKPNVALNFSNFDSLKSTETFNNAVSFSSNANFSNFDSLKSTETQLGQSPTREADEFQQFRLVEEY